MKVKCTGNGITDNGDGTCTVLCGDREVKVRYEGEKK